MDKVVLVAAVAGLVLGSAHGQADAEWALGQLRGANVVFGSCVDNFRGHLAAFSQAECPERDEVFVVDFGREVSARFITTWYDAYPTLASFESDVAAAGPVRQHWVALAAGVTLNDMATGLPGGMVLVDFLLASESTWAMVVTPRKETSSNVLAALAGKARFVVPLTTLMSTSPLATLLEGSQTNAGFVAEVVADSDAEALASGWARAVMGGHAGPSTVAFDAKNKHRVVAKTRSEAQFLAAQPEVAWVSPAAKLKFSNEDAAAMLQSGYEGAASEWQTSLADKMSVWNRGIKGQGQVVGVADSGLQVSQCMFQDNVAQDMANMRRRRDGGARIKYDYAGHRKVVQYVAWADGIEGVFGGHGTHVAGTVAGSPKSSSVPGVLRGPTGAMLVDAVSQQGVAPEAKLAFLDIGEPDEDATAVLPPNEASNLLGPSKEAGAFLHTNSWGGDLGQYEYSTRSIDAYLFGNQDFAVLFAAGNAGSGLVSTAGERIFAGGNTIGFPALAKNVITVGATQNAERSFRENSATDDEGGVACFKDSASARCADSLAFFSSKGPTGDGRFKPDIVAPGFFISSSMSVVGTNSQTGAQEEPDSCNFFDSLGTSMATPAMAGAAALVRQWYTDGYFVAGVEDKARGIKPMGALIKASLVHSAETIGGFSVDTPTGTSRKIPLDGKPDVQEGFGRPMLENLMGSSADDYLAPFIVGDFDNMVSLGDNETYTATFDVLDASDLLRATLVWYDVPASVASVRQLVNDLDLAITAPSGKVYLGNGEAAPDRLNTVEQIDVPPAELEVGEYTLTISAKVHVARQPFALLVSGPFERPSTPRPTASPTRSPARSPEPEAGLSTGAIIGIGAGAGVVLLSVAGVVAWKMCGSKKRALNAGPEAQHKAPASY